MNCQALASHDVSDMLGSQHRLNLVSVSVDTIYMRQAMLSLVSSLLPEQSPEEAKTAAAASNFFMVASAAKTKTFSVTCIQAKLARQPSEGPEKTTLGSAIANNLQHQLFTIFFEARLC